MDSVKHILIPTDGSEPSLNAAAFAGNMARAFGASVSIVAVIEEDLVVAEAWGGATADDARRKIESRKSKEELDRTREAVGDLPSAPATAVLMGHVGDQICKFAEDGGVDLIVMGSHGRTGIKRVLLGSVSHSVVNQAPCSVTIVR